MTDNLKFYDPETGADLHRAPDGVKIPACTTYGFIRSDGSRGWVDGGAGYTFDQLPDAAYFTREPLSPPAPPLPTEPGYYLDKNGDLWRLNGFKQWKSLVSLYNFTPRDAESFAPFSPASIIPTETWDRLCVLDPEDKWDRVDSEGRVWRYSKEFDGWESENGIRFYTLEVLANHFGPLRFAHEVSDQ